MKRNQTQHTARLISLLAVLLTASSVVSCGNAEPDPSVGDTKSVQETAVTAESTAPESTVVPFSGKTEADFGGKTFTIYTEGWWDYAPLAVTDITADAQTGDSLDDAVYSRNSLIGELFNCQVAQADFGHYEQAFSNLRKVISAGDTVYDLCIMRGLNYQASIRSGYLCDLYALNIDYTQPWWDQESLKGLAVGKAVYGVLSDITTNSLLSVGCTFYNKQLVTDFDFEEPNELVRTDHWTYQKLFETAKAVASDLDGNGIRNEADRYGVCYIQDISHCLLNSLGMRYGEQDKNGKILFTFADDDRKFTQYTSILENLFDDSICFNGQLRQGFPLETGIFTSGQCLYCLGFIQYTPAMRNMETDFGILPYPKYEETQDGYYSCIAPNSLTLTCVPTINENYEDTAIFLDYYAYLGYRDVRPQFYEVLLRNKVARDEASVEMLDYIFGRLSIDIGAVFNFGDFPNQLMLGINQKKLDYASFLASFEKKIAKDVDAVNAMAEGETD